MAKAADRDRVAAALSGLPSRISSYGTQSRSLSPGRLKKMATDGSGGFSPVSGLPGRQPARLLWASSGLVHCKRDGVRWATDLQGSRGVGVSTNGRLDMARQGARCIIRGNDRGSRLDYDGSRGRGGEAGAVGSDVVDGVGQDLTDDLRSHPICLRRKHAI